MMQRAALSTAVGANALYVIPRLRDHAVMKRIMQRGGGIKDECGYLLISLGSPRVRRTQMRRTCGEPNGTDLAAIAVW